MFRTTSRAAILVALTQLVAPPPAAALEAGVGVGEASKQQKQAAKRSYQEALEALEAGKLDDALALLETSYAVVASPNSRLLYARVLVKLGRDAEAHGELAAVVVAARELARTDPKYEQTAQAAEKEQGEVAGRLSTLTIVPATEVQIDGSDLAPEQFGRPLTRVPGKVKLTLKHADGTTSEQELELKPGESTKVTAAPPERREEKPEPPPAPAAPPVPASKDAVSKKTLGFVTGGIGIAGIGTFTALKVMNASGGERAGCDAQSCPRSTVRDAERNSSLQAFGYAALGIGVIGVVSSTLLFLGSAEDEKPPGTAVGLGPGYVSLSGRF